MLTFWQIDLEWPQFARFHLYGKSNPTLGITVLGSLSACTPWHRGRESMSLLHPSWNLNWSWIWSSVQNLWGRGLCFQTETRKRLRNEGADCPSCGGKPSIMAKFPSNGPIWWDSGQIFMKRSSLIMYSIMLVMLHKPLTHAWLCDITVMKPPPSASVFMQTNTMSS